MGAKKSSTPPVPPVRRHGRSKKSSTPPVPLARANGHIKNPPHPPVPWVQGGGHRRETLHVLCWYLETQHLGAQVALLIKRRSKIQTFLFFTFSTFLKS